MISLAADFGPNGGMQKQKQFATSFLIRKNSYVILYTDFRNQKIIPF